MAGDNRLPGSRKFRSFDYRGRLMNDIKLEIKALSNQAALLSHQATVAFKNKYFNEEKK